MSSISRVLSIADTRGSRELLDCEAIRDYLTVSVSNVVWIIDIRGPTERSRSRVSI